MSSFIGDQARGAAPSNFDIKYADSLGHVAAILAAANGLSGYMATISNLKVGVEHWKPGGGVPISALMTTRAGTGTLSVSAARQDRPPKCFLSKVRREEASLGRPFKISTRIQGLCGSMAPLRTRSPTPSSWSPSTPSLGSRACTVRSKTSITAQCRPGCSSTVLQSATTNLTALTDILQLVHEEAEANHPAAGLKKESNARLLAPAEISLWPFDSSASVGGDRHRVGLINHFV